jgi:Uncharacterised nucleotidyltransferase
MVLLVAAAVARGELAKGAWIAQVQAKEALRRVLDLGDAQGIELLPVKGIITGHDLYADVAERPLTDLDLRVRRQELPELRAAVRGAGWREVTYSRAYRNLVFEIDGWMVDVEASVGPPGLCALTVDEMIRRASRRTEPFGFSYLRPEVHDHALLLCVNAFKDKMVNANEGALADLQRLPETAGFRLDEFVARARASEIVTLTWMVADWLVEHRGAERWREIRSALGTKPPRHAYASLLSLAIRLGSRSLPTRLLARAGADSRSGRWTAVMTAGQWRLEGWVRLTRGSGP